MAGLQLRRTHYINAASAARRFTMARKTNKASATYHTIEYSNLEWNIKRDQLAERLPLMWRQMGITASCMDGYTEQDRFAARESLLGQITTAYALGAIDCWMKHLLQQMIEAARAHSRYDLLWTMLRECEHIGCCTVHQYVAKKGVNASIVEVFSKDRVREFLSFYTK